MVSLQAALSQKERTISAVHPNSGGNLSSRKRKWEDGEEGEEHRERLPKELKLWNDARRETPSPPPPPPVSGIELHLEKPLPLDWQRCLDIQSGKIHFYNTRTQKRTSRDPRENSEEPPAASTWRHMSLDLELNLTCESSPRSHGEGEEERGEGETKHADDDIYYKNAASAAAAAGSLSRAPSWVSLDTPDADRREMVAAVCMRCHMLVIMCTSSPSCPNCKFLHPPNQGPSSPMFKPGFRLLCCKD